MERFSQIQPIQSLSISTHCKNTSRRGRGNQEYARHLLDCSPSTEPFKIEFWALVENFNKDTERVKVMINAKLAQLPGAKNNSSLAASQMPLLGCRSNLPSVRSTGHSTADLA